MARGYTRGQCLRFILLLLLVIIAVQLLVGLRSPGSVGEPSEEERDAVRRAQTLLRDWKRRQDQRYMGVGIAGEAPVMILRDPRSQGLSKHGKKPQQEGADWMTLPSRDRLPKDSSMGAHRLPAGEEEEGGRTTSAVPQQLYEKDDKGNLVVATSLPPPPSHEPGTPPAAGAGTSLAASTSSTLPPATNTNNSNTNNTPSVEGEVVIFPPVDTTAAPSTTAAVTMHEHHAVVNERLANAHARARREALETIRRAQEKRLGVAEHWAGAFKKAAKRLVTVSYTDWGNVEPPEALKHIIQTTYRSEEQQTAFTEAELLALHGNLDIVYTWVNGSEYNHLFRKAFRRANVRRKLADGSVFRPPANGGPTQGTTTALPPHLNASLKDQFLPSSWKPMEALAQDGVMSNLEVVENLLDSTRVRQVTSRDRESDELRYSFRSLDQYTEWHRGRIVIVSPGHCPQWLDQASNFFATARRPQGFSRRRVICVHQDTVLPGNQRLTFNTNTVEQHIYKLKNLSNLFVQFNDDYFVNHNTSIQDFVNNRGGPILLHEGGELRGAAQAARNIRKIWLGGVYHSNSFNIRELEEVPADYIPKYVEADVLAKMVERELRQEDILSILGSSSTTAAAGTETAEPRQQEPQSNQQNTVEPDASSTLSTARTLQEAMISKQTMRLAGGRPVADRLVDKDGNPLKEQVAKKKRHFLKHAPFVYCKGIFEHLAIRYQRDLLPPTLANQHRHKEDFLMPFLHNAFIMDRPWVGSAKYLPQLAAALARNHSASTEAPLLIALDGVDGCAPALNKIGEAAKSLLVIFTDDTAENERRVQNLANVDPVFFALNDGFSRDHVAKQLQQFMREKYPIRSLFEVLLDDDDDNSLHEAAAGSGETTVAAGSGTAAVAAQGSGSSQLSMMLQPGAYAKKKDEKTSSSVGSKQKANSQQQQGGSSSLGSGSSERALWSAYDDLMALPLVVLASDVGQLCPIARSLRLALPGHNGPLVLVVDSFAQTPTWRGMEPLTDMPRLEESGDAIRDDFPRLHMRCVFEDLLVTLVEGPVNDVASHKLDAYTRAMQVLDFATGSVATLRLSEIDNSVLRQSVEEQTANSSRSTQPQKSAPEVQVRAIVLDVRRTLEEGPNFLAMPGQTLSLEDFLFYRNESTSEQLYSGDGAYVLTLSPSQHGLPPFGPSSPSSSLSPSSADVEWKAGSSRRGDRYSHLNGGQRRQVLKSLSTVNWIVGLSEYQLLYTYPVGYSKYESRSLASFGFGYER